MKRHKVHIESLLIKVPHGAAPQARAMARSLGEEILRGVAKVAAGRSGARTISQLCAARVSAIDAVNDSGLKTKVAGQVVTELMNRLDD